MQTRRKFLRDCSVVAATASLVHSAALAQNQATRRGVPTGAGLVQFVRELNTAFTVRTATKRIKLRLIEASAFLAAASDSEDARNEKFWLLFHGPVLQPLEQDTYLFEHPRLGRQSIFIVPIGSLDPQNCVYEAIFDRPVSPTEFAAQLSRAPRRVQKG